MTTIGRRLALRHAFRGDAELWQWLGEEELDARGGVLPVTGAHVIYT